MGNLMRQYWLPAIMSRELAADGAPMRLMLLGEKLIAFRDSQGRVGVMDHRCPHRCASMFLGRNEESGIRCIYHGWKFDVEGNCIDMPSVPPEQDFKDKVKAKAYRVREANGLIWVYMGDREQLPELPMIEPSLVPGDELDISMVLRDCNFVQSLEGDIDTAHFGFLHAGNLDPENVPSGHPLDHTATERAPRYHVRETDWGTSYGAFRNAGEGKTYWRFANFMFPFWTQTPQGEFDKNVHARAWVPLDDTHTMMVFLRWRSDMPNLRQRPLKDGSFLGGSLKAAEYQPISTEWLGRWRLKANESNDWTLDREAQQNNSIYSGIENIHLQDQAVTESMGGITDHDFEHLGPSDQMIARTRRRLLKAARALAEKKTVPPGVDNPEVFLKSRSGYFVVDEGIDWLQAYEDQVDKAVRPAQKAALAPSAVSSSATAMRAETVDAGAK
ncbi:Rieske 2Fe-2S domain-containing protein [Variovorax saccharolyticus]|uniref:Rieske 2Fe-2S domain-containing protein n=1 Tax=Variovorax saccharolyticus TaxID=3053516 RepID=UPI002574FFC1|nr:Rieske 2Fe-2S domain-containing protein [Variovorax sp. J22R187]MDM0021898.1 Rieske 2Fe-2S domain-containing protein [Variovorax sp. J22R187]